MFMWLLSLFTCGSLLLVIYMSKKDVSDNKKAIEGLSNFAHPHIQAFVSDSESKTLALKSYCESLKIT